VPQIAGNTLKGIAVLSRGRFPLLPALATAHEQGLTDFEAVSWSGFFMPKGTPAPIVKKINAAVNDAMDNAGVKERMHDLGVTLVASERRSPNYLQKFVADEIAKWAGPIKAAGISLD
jgi:tripartite-type tricarboxylate transporter receptor subunit TctC